MSCRMGSGCGGGDGESGGAGGCCWERCEPNRSSRERCFCLMLLEITRGPVEEGDEGGVLSGDCSRSGLTGGGGGGTNFSCMQKGQDNVRIYNTVASESFQTAPIFSMDKTAVFGHQSILNNL